MKTSNPVFSDKIFTHRAKSTEATMTINGTIFKTMILLGLLIFSAIFVWSRFITHQFTHVRSLLTISIPISLVIGFITPFKPRWSPFTAPLYAISQGVVVGAFSSIAEMIYPGVVSQAIPLTLFVLFGMLLLYTSGLIKVTRRFSALILMASFSIFLTYLLEFVLNFFGISMPYIHDRGPIGIAFSVIVVIVAAFSLMIDFDFIVKSQSYGVPAYMEWYCAYGLMVSLVWLYVRILELLVKTSKRNN